MATASQTIADFALELRAQELPGAVVEAAKLQLLDGLGCALAAAATEPGVPSRTALVALHGHGPATAIGAPDGLPAPAAACVNGALTNALDYDDTHLDGIVNTGAVVGPAALAAAEVAGAGGRELLTAFVAGTEVLARIGLACAPGFRAEGFHPAAVCGPYGAAVAGALLGGLDRRTTVHALGVAGSMASGTYEPLVDGTRAKAFQVGWAAHSGLLACSLAAAGLDGPAAVLDGRGGLLSAFFGLGPDALREQLADLGRRWETLRVTIRDYPACYYIHGPLEAVRQAVGETTFTAAEVARVRVSIPAAGVGLVVEPQATRARPATDYEGRFSLAYSVAAMLARGRVDLSSYTPEAIADPEVLALAARVVHVPRDFGAGGHPGAVAVELADGRTLSAEVERPGPPPGAPIDAARTRAKFHANAALALDAGTAAALEDAVDRLETLPTLTPLTACLAAGARSPIPT